MKRLAVIVSVGGLLIGLVFFLSPRIAARLVPSVPSLSEAAAPPESEELTPPIVEVLKVPGTTHVLITASAEISDQSIRRVKLERLTPTGKWRGFGRLKDDGKAADANSGDGVFTLRKEKEYANATTETFRLSATRNGTRVRVVSPAIDVVVSSLPTAMVSIGGGVGLTPPATWYVATFGTVVDFISPETQRAIDRGAADTPQDISAQLLTKNATTTLSDFALSFDGGWFEPYALAEPASYSGYPALHISDIGNIPGRSPVAVYFVEVSPTEVLLVSINDYETEDTPSLQATVEQMLGAL